MEMLSLGYSRKNPTVVVDFSEPHPPGIFRFVTLPLVIRNFGENNLSPLEILKIIPRQKPRPMEIPN